VRTVWTPAIQDEMVSLIEEGYSASIVAEKLSETFDIPFTKNSVIGRWKRTKNTNIGNPKTRRLGEQLICWSEEKIRFAKRLRRKKLSYVKIAQEMSTVYGMRIPESSLYQAMRRANA